MKKILFIFLLTCTIQINAQCPITVTGNHSVCDGISDTLTASGAASYNWMPGNLNGSSVIVLPLATTVYTVTGITGTCTATNTVLVTVNPKPVPDFVGDILKSCPNLSVHFADLSVAPGPPNTIISWVWSFGNSYTSSSAFPPQQVYFNNSNTQNAYYTVSLKVTSDSGCVNTKTKNNYITVYPRPLANIDTVPSTCAPLCTNFTSTLSVGANSYNWDFGNGNTSVSANPSQCYTVAGTYIASLKVSNTYVCSDSTQTTVVVTNCSGISQYSNLSSQISIYPNPSNGIFNLSISQFDNEKTHDIEIYNLIGECVHRQNIISATSKIDVNSLPNGIYNISLTSSKGIENKHIVIVK